MVNARNDRIARNASRRAGRCWQIYLRRVNANSRSHLRNLGVALGTAALVAVAAPSTQASTPTSSSSGATALGTYDISSPRIALDASGECFSAEMDIDVQVSLPDTYWNATFTVGPAGAVPLTSGFASGESSVSSAFEYTYCPTVFKPTNVVLGTIEFTHYGDIETTTAKSDFRFDVSVARAATQTTITKVSRDSLGNLTVTGRVTTNSTRYGRVGASGVLYLYVKGPRKKWTRIGEGYVNGGLGEYTIYPGQSFPRKKASFRVDFIGTDVTTPSKSKPKSA